MVCATESYQSLAENNLGLTIHTTRKLRASCSGMAALSFEEAEAVANLALVRAAMMFRPQLGFTFTTYACRVIRNDLLRAMKAELDHRSLHPELHDNIQESPSRATINTVDLNDEIEFIRRHLKLLKASERRILKKFYGIGCQRMCAAKIATECGQSRRTIKKRILAAIDLLRASSDADC